MSAVGSTPDFSSLASAKYLLYSLRTVKETCSREVAMDGLRGCAILMVLCSHFGITPPGTFPWGVVGVRFFFLLSGCYLMQRIYLMHPGCETDPGKRISLIDFYGSRFGRLFPVCYAALLVSALSGWGFNLAELPWHLLFLTNFLAVTKGIWPESFGHFWSLSVQIQFYLLLPLLFLKVPRKFFGTLLLGGIGLSLLYRAFCLGTETSPMLRWLFLPGCFDAFATGALIIYIEKEHRDLLQILNRFLLPGFIGGFLALSFAYILRMSCSTGIQAAFTESFECIFLFFVMLWIRNRKQSLTTRLLRFSPLARVGMISYSIYAFHPWVHIFFLGHVAPRLTQVGVSTSWQFLPLFLMVFAVALISCKTIEHPRFAATCTSAFHRIRRVSFGHLLPNPSTALRLGAVTSLALLLFFNWTFHSTNAPTIPVVVGVPQEIQELQSELQSSDPEETPIVTQDPPDEEPIQEEMPQEVPQIQDDESEMTL